MITPKNYHYIHRLSKRIAPFFKKTNRFTKVLERKERLDLANKFISEKIREGSPLMVGRYGRVESRVIVNFLELNRKQSDLKAISRHLLGRLNIFWKKNPVFFDNLCKRAGFFPNNDKLLGRFVDVILEASTSLDLLGVWNELEEYIPMIPDSCKLSKIREIEPWFYDEPWSYHLKGKKVLVIHPFEESIRYQYEVNRTNLYKNDKVLPEFDLKTIKAVQSIADEEVEYSTWFDALDDMKRQIDVVDFDVAIIGCGAYGFPLASYVKSKGKQAIHLGGVTQLLFGIKGARWEEWEHYISLRKDDGKYWIKAKEIPKGYKKVEGGCYW
ncbi:hypothetical protein PG279_00275 [Riemerella anatipestifer]|nr:hypothetical protein [Riemerella anatipestifer]